MIQCSAYNQTITVEPDGALLTSYTRTGQDVLMPRQQLDGSWRGGCHVCMPNFGSGGESGLAQHGFGRTSTWQVSQQTDSGLVLTLQASEGSYHGLACSITYQLAPTGLAMVLTATNGAHAPVRLAPGWHPYFALPAGSDGGFTLDGSPYNAVEYAEAQFIRTTGQLALSCGDNNYTLVLSNLTTVALWSAHPSRYICVEPTLAGNSFTDEPTAPARELLAPGHTTEYRLDIQL